MQIYFVHYIYLLQVNHTMQIWPKLAFILQGIGSDRLSFDVGKSETYPVHSVIGTENLYGLENVANIHKIPHKGATVVVLPMPLEKGTGGPTRILAFWGNNNEIITSDCVITGRASILMIVCMLIMHTFVHLI